MELGHAKDLNEPHGVQAHKITVCAIIHCYSTPAITHLTEYYVCGVNERFRMKPNTELCAVKTNPFFNEIMNAYSR